MLVRTDAQNVGLINEALRLVMPELDRTEFGEYKYADTQGFIPEDPLTAPGVDSLTQARLTVIGAWRLAADAATNVEKIDFGLDYVTYGAHYFQAFTSWSSQELDRMAFAASNPAMKGVALNVTQEKMMAVEETYLQLKNRVNSMGIPRLNIFGLHTHPDVPRFSAPYRLGMSRTPEENLALLAQFNTQIRRNTSQRESADTLLLPDQDVQQLSLQKVGDAAGTSTLQFFLDNNPYITAIDSSVELDTAGPGGTPIAQAYRRDPRKVRSLVPKKKTQIGPVTFTNGEWRADFDAQLGGVHFRRPYSSLIMEFPAA
jgi:hypothetical protein